MRIGIISFHCCPFSLIGGDGVGGMNAYLKELSSELTGIPDVYVDIFTRIQNPAIRGIRPQNPSLRVVHLRGGPESPFDRKRIYDCLPEFTRNLENFISRQKHGYDVLYSHYWLSGLAGKWLKYRKGLPLAHTYHTLAFLKNKALGEKEHEQRVFEEHGLALGSDVIISTSTEEKESLVAETGVSPSKVRVIYPGVNKNLFHPVEDGKILREIGTEEGERFLIYVGRIEPVKGLMSVIRAFHILKRGNSALSDHLKLVVVGGGDKGRDFKKNREIRRIKKAVRDMDLESRIVFTGSQKQDRLKSLYSAADALVVPSLYESFGLVVLEALACGTPVLVSQIGKMKTIVKEGKNGFCFKPGQAESISSCVDYFYRHSKQLWSGERIRRDVIGKFSWERSGKETHRVLMSLLERKSGFTTIFRPGESPRPA